MYLSVSLDLTMFSLKKNMKLWDFDWFSGSALLGSHMCPCKAIWVIDYELWINLFLGEFLQTTCAMP